MSYHLASGQHAAVVGDRLIVLDVAADRYRLLGPPAAMAFQAMASGDVTHPGLERLCALGIVEPGPWQSAVPAVPSPITSALEHERGAFQDLGFLTAATGVLRALAELKGRGLAALLDGVARKAGPRAQANAVTIGLAQRFALHRSRLPLRNICLAESSALHRILIRRGLAASFIIGVRLNPFGAHCWLQADDHVLNDSCDHVSQFTPILAL